MAGETVVLDAGHGSGSTSRLGATHGDLVERELILAYVEHIRDRLAHHGVASAVVDRGRYSDRQAHWSVATADAYLACHVNAPAGGYALVLHKARDTQGAHLARSVLRGLMRVHELKRGVRGVYLTGLEEGHDGGSERHRGRTIRTVAWGKPGPYRDDSHMLGRNRGLICIQGVPEHVPAVLVEPGFIGEPAHGPLWTADGLKRLGYCIADGIVEYLRGP